MPCDQSVSTTIGTRYESCPYETAISRNCYYDNSTGGATGRLVPYWLALSGLRSTTYMPDNVGADRFDLANVSIRLCANLAAMHGDFNIFSAQDNRYCFGGYKAVCTTDIDVAGFETLTATVAHLGDCRRLCASRSDCTFLSYTGARDVKGTLVGTASVFSKFECNRKCVELGWSCTHFGWSSSADFGKQETNCWLKKDMVKGLSGKNEANFMMETCFKTVAEPSVCGLNPSPCGEAGSWLTCSPELEYVDIWNPKNNLYSWRNYTCRCAPGYYYNSAQRKCLPNKCVNNDPTVSNFQNPCGSATVSLRCNPTSINLGGGTFQPDYTSSPCAVSPSPCGAAQTFSACTPTSTSEVSCTCATGYTLDSTSKQCIRDVCAVSPSPCGSAAAYQSCTSNGGTSHTCVCKPEYFYDTKRNTCVSSCTAGNYFDTALSTCKANPCAASPSPCGPSNVFSTCAARSTAPFYTCTCRAGFTFNGTTCVESAATGNGGACSTNPCGDSTKSSRCTNLPEATPPYVCSCKTPSFLYDAGVSGGTCTANPCAASPNPCGVAGAYKTCTPKSSIDWTCSCAMGYFFNGESRACQADSIPPVLTTPTGIVVEATSAIQGAQVMYEAKAYDLVSGIRIPTCKPESGSWFPMSGNGVGTRVVCMAEDAAGNRVTKSFRVRVVDSTPPTFNAIPNIVKESDNLEGTTVDFASSLSYSDASGAVSVVCSPASGSFFRVGEPTKGECNVVGDVTLGGTATCVATSGGSLEAIESSLVVCTATDSYGNTARRNFTVTVVKPTPPVFQNPMPAVVSDSGTALMYALPTATDAHSPTSTVNGVGYATVTCFPSPGFTFPVGTTLVSCTATDFLGLTSEASFTVTIACMSRTPMTSGSNDYTQMVPFDLSPSTLGGLYPLTRVMFYFVNSWIRGVGLSMGGPVPTAVYSGQPAPEVPHPDIITLDLDAGETIIRASVDTGSYVNWVSFLTNKARTLTAKQTRDNMNMFTMTPGEPPACASALATARICAFHGAFDNTTLYPPPGLILREIGPVWCWETAGAIIVPDNFTVEASEPGGATVTYTITTTIDTTATCTPQSGSLFPIGTTQVACNPTGVASGAGGPAASFNVTVGSFFPVGVTTVPTEVVCKFESYSTEYKFNVHVWASAAPYFEPSPPTNVLVDANHPLGATVTDLLPVAKDDHFADPDVECNPPSDFIFPHGETVVRCVATDGVGLQTTTEFNVTVQYPCLSNPSPCGPPEAYIDCNAIGQFDFSCVCSAGYAPDNTGACTRNLTQQACNNGTAQWFEFHATSTSGVYGICMRTDLCLTARGESVSGWPLVTMAGKDLNGAPDQRFYVRPVVLTTSYEYGSVASSTRVGYTLSPIQRPTKCLSVLGGTALDGQPIVLSDCVRLGQNASPEQIFGLPLSDSTAFSGSMLMPYGVTVMTNAIVIGANGKSDDMAPILPVAINFTLTWSVADHPPSESAMEAVLGSKVTPHFDTTKPVFIADNLTTTVTTSGPEVSGMALGYTVSAEDDFYISAPVTCSPKPDTVLPIGSHKVECRAQDGSGNYELLDFTVEIKQPL
ncbi:hypothetical protein GPECTOR_24g185 [Gonium pectorale]|uniref:HYR domain-containing protein n=1 Tax=Gonium pectorale TaxID=33097 RepID=A0A150GGE4_GONPE|nr:hypothetical protein GPECTOR_24g185 [Gonium pectorale]|eukprot:KXZ48896.1 hypothetical protein GPECTOR_24g185 [Gonium pectorale]